MGDLRTKSIGQWTVPYTKRQDLNSSRNVRIRTSYTPLLRLHVNHIHYISSGARPYLRWLSDRRGSHHRGLQPSSVSTQLFDRVAEGPQPIITVTLSKLSCYTCHVTGSTSFTPLVRSTTLEARARRCSWRVAIASAYSWRQSIG